MFMLAVELHLNNYHGMTMSASQRERFNYGPLSSSVAELVVRMGYQNSNASYIPVSYGVVLHFCFLHNNSQTMLAGHILMREMVTR